MDKAFFDASKDILDKVKRGVFDQGKVCASRAAFYQSNLALSLRHLISKWLPLPGWLDLDRDIAFSLCVCGTQLC